jgi:hypothetical protein
MNLLVHAIKISVWLALLTFSALARAEVPARKAYPCHRLPGPVTIDGQLDEAAWNGLPESTGFFLLKTRAYSKERQTAFRIGWDDQAIYVGFRCSEPAAEELAALPPEKRGGWGGEIIEFFFMRERPKYRQFAVDVNGSVEFASSFVRTMYAKTDLPRTGIAAAGRIGAGAWTLEVKFPFSCFDAPAQAGDAWRFNLCRDSALGARKSGERLMTWSFSETHFHDYDVYSALEFRGDTLSAAQADQETARINATYRADSAKQGEADRRMEEKKRLIAAATPLAWKTGPRNPLYVDTRLPLWDEKRGHRYYGDLPVAFECQWAESATINACQVTWCGPIWFSNYRPLVAEDFGLEYWDGRAWQLVFHEIANEDSTCIKTFKPVTTTRVRLTVFRATPNFETLRVRSFDLFNLPGQ